MWVDLKMSEGELRWTDRLVNAFSHLEKNQGSMLMYLPPTAMGDDHNLYFTSEAIEKTNFLMLGK